MEVKIYGDKFRNIIPSLILAASTLHISLPRSPSSPLDLSSLLHLCKLSSVFLTLGFKQITQEISFNMVRIWELRAREREKPVIYTVGRQSEVANSRQRDSLFFSNGPRASMRRQDILYSWRHLGTYGAGIPSEIRYQCTYIR